MEVLERWLDVPGYERYEVSDLGGVRNKKTLRLLKPQSLHQKSLRSKPGRGHVAVRLYRAGLPKGQDIGLHRLVLLAFKGPCPDGMEGCHNDGDAKNNSLGNLRWDTQTNNQADRVAHGTTIRGERNSHAILDESKVKLIRQLYAGGGHTMRHIADSFGVARTTVSAVVHGATWRHLENGGGLSR